MGLEVILHGIKAYYLYINVLSGPGMDFVVSLKSFEIGRKIMVNELIKFWLRKRNLVSWLDVSLV